MQMGYIKAELIRRKWISWAKQSLPSFLEVSKDEARLRLEESRKSDPPRGHARCYEHEEVLFEDFAQALASGLEKLKVREAAAMIGDYLSPATFCIKLSDLNLLLRKASADTESLILMPNSIKGRIEVDLPPSDGQYGNMMLITTAECEPLIDDIKLTLPGGLEFRGN